jgi:hypothetical protein
MPISDLKKLNTWVQQYVWFSQNMNMNFLEEHFRKMAALSLLIARIIAKNKLGNDELFRDAYNAWKTCARLYKEESCLK